MHKENWNLRDPEIESDNGYKAKSTDGTIRPRTPWGDQLRDIKGQGIWGMNPRNTDR